MSSRTVQSHDISLAVREYGDPGSPHVVLVHGYPDDQTLWEGVVAGLGDYHCITYDVRGAGNSSTPAQVRDYRNELLTDDLVAVVEAAVPEGEPFHLVAHDWGSIQSWDSVTDPRLSGRIASFVSASGPSVDHIAGSRNRRGGALLRQLGHSLYVFGFQLPWLPEQLWRREALAARLIPVLAAQDGESEWSPRLARNASNGVNLYRANILRKMLNPRPKKVTVPVLLVVATRDTFVGPVYLAPIADHCDDLTRVEIDAAHWHPRAHPELLIDILQEHLPSGDACQQRRGSDQPG